MHFGYSRTSGLLRNFHSVLVKMTTIIWRMRAEDIWTCSNALMQQHFSFPPLFYLEKTRTCCRRWTVGTCCWTRWGGRVKTTPLWATSTSTMSSWGSCRSARTPRGYWRRWGWETHIHSKVYKFRELVHRAHTSLLCRPFLNAKFESECAALQWSMI